jgi:hypothetical protein
LDFTRLTEAARSAIPNIADQPVALQLSNSAKQVDDASNDLRTCIHKASQFCGSLRIEAVVGLIESYLLELEEFRIAANSRQLKPLPG